MNPIEIPSMTPISVKLSVYKKGHKLSPQEQQVLEETKIRDSIKTILEQNPGNVPPNVLYLIE